MIDPKEKTDIKNLYQSFGYEVSEEREEYCVFLMKTGIYYGADILCFDDSCPSIIESIKMEYYKAGYATRSIKYDSFEILRDSLFDKIFNTSTQREKQRKKYSDFTSHQLSFIPEEKCDVPPKYEYQNSDYEVFSYGENEINAEGSITDKIIDIINSSGPKLIIVEAAAGFGKTCTAYELLNRTLVEKNCFFPLFTELSKNRKAPIFRYVLLSEINDAFDVNIKEELVLKYIESGDIPLIIDGFDELISSKVKNRNDTSDAEFQQVESMLSTIMDLLTDQAKIILTSRKTAVFSSPEFFSWVTDNQRRFDTIRFIIKAPDIKNWLSPSRLKAFSGTSRTIPQLNNPVLLALLKYCSDETFERIINDTNELTDVYFELLLSREIDRQELKLSVSDQKQIFKNLAKFFFLFDIYHEDKDFIIQAILEENSELLEQSRELYQPDSRPSLPELLEKLSNHVLLNKHGDDENAKIGFINDFVFGILLGESISESDNDSFKGIIDSSWLSLVLTAYGSKDRKSRKRLWDKLNSIPGFIDSDVFLIDTILTNQIQHDLVDISFNHITCESQVFSGHTILNCSFVYCVFNNCVFDFSCFSGKSMFISCVFNNCSIFDSSIPIKNEVIFFSCQDYGSGITQIDNEARDEVIESKGDLAIDILRSLVSKSGKTKFQLLSNIMSMFTSDKPKTIEKCINELNRKGLIFINGNYIHISMDGKRMLHSED